MTPFLIISFWYLWMLNFSGVVVSTWNDPPKQLWVADAPICLRHIFQNYHTFLFFQTPIPKKLLVAGFNPFQKIWTSQIGNLPQFLGWNENIFETTTKSSNDPCGTIWHPWLGPIVSYRLRVLHAEPLPEGFLWSCPGQFSKVSDTKGTGNVEKHA